ncbi:MAG: efflux transporter outer membrane subunit [Burkholderiales bacterium]
MKITPARFLAVLLCACAGGCTVTGEPYRQPQVSTPAAWEGEREGIEKGAWPDPQWWKRFEMPALDQLIALAQERNHDLRAASARVAQARAALRTAGAGRYPALAVAAGVARSKDGGENAETLSALGPQAAYEFDFWGKNRYARDAANAFVNSSVYAREALKLSLTADVANTYFLILSLNDRIGTSKNNLANARQLLDLVNVQRRAGRVSDFEVARQRVEVSAAEAAIPALIHQRRIAQDALAVLLGRHFEAAQTGTESLREARLPEGVSGVPSQLVERRPDVRQAEAALAGANANIGAARAALFPGVTLRAEGGWRGDAAASLFAAGSGFFSVGLDLLQVIFDGGRLRGQVDLAIAVKTELVEAYQQSIVVSFREVEDALSGVEQFALQENFLRQAVVHAREAYRLADARYKAGAVDFTTILDAQRALLAAEAAADPVRLARFTSQVGLYRALGGGWKDPAPAPASR